MVEQCPVLLAKVWLWLTGPMALFLSLYSSLPFSLPFPPRNSPCRLVNTDAKMVSYPSTYLSKAVPLVSIPTLAVAESSMAWPDPTYSLTHTTLHTLPYIHHLCVRSKYLGR
ncbi:hypothetical protein F5Y12DRAFT_401110 [Xylaria sp. FL1777]|nr:hypothetical protein F5Y12DRAFT_401110 [Xylaria sp. FL1777]